MKLHRYIASLENAEFAEFSGNITAIRGGNLEANGPLAKVGDYCEVQCGDGNDRLLAEVISLQADGIRMVPLSNARFATMGAKVVHAMAMDGVSVGDEFAGRAVNALGVAIDDLGPIEATRHWPREGRVPKTLDRTAASCKLPTGIRAIDGLLPIGQGQRVGIFAASGVGKTSLVEQLSRQIECDRIILCLVGERGREVEKLWSMHLKGQSRKRFTIVAATSEESASMRARAVDQALGIAEYWRAQGANVVLFIDSITRLALALRELGLAAGEPPTVRAFTPNVFAAMPRIVERCGVDRNAGSITAIFTVLSETDDVDDPIVELMKSLLDGHIILSRRLAEKGHFPAIDLSASVSRMAPELFDKAEALLARAAHRTFAEFDEARPMIESGLYKNGSNEQIDKAIARFPQLSAFLQQEIEQESNVRDTRNALTKIFPEAANHG